MELTGFYTQRGLELQAELQAAGEPAVVSRVCAGSGATTAAALTLSDERMALTVGTPHRKGAVTALPVTLAEIQAETDFLLTEIGVYVRDTDGGEVLCRVYRLGQNIPVTAGGRTVIRLELEEAFGEAAALRAEGTPGGLLPEGDLAALRGGPGGLATLDGAGDVPVGQIPALDYAASSHAGRHGSGGADTVTPASIGAAASGHTHTPASIGAAASGHTHTPASIGAADSGHTHTPASIGAAPAYSYGTADLTAGVSALETGKLYFVYE